MNSSSVPKWSIEHAKISNAQTLLALAVAPQPQPNTPRVLIFFFFFCASLHEQGMVVMVQETGFFRTRCLIFYSFTLMSHRLMNRKNQINGPPFAGWFFPRGLYSVRLGSGFHLVTPVRINIDRLWVAIRVYHQDQEIFSPSRTKPGEEKVVPHSALIFYFILFCGPSVVFGKAECEHLITLT